MINWDIKSILSLIFGVAFVAFTAMGKIPIEVFTPIAAMLITYWFEERKLERLQEMVREIMEKGLEVARGESHEK